MTAEAHQMDQGGSALKDQLKEDLREIISSYGCLIEAEVNNVESFYS